jgi:adenylosuccinate lyase
MGEAPQNALYERYASREMGALFSAAHRYQLWRRVWIALAECERELGLPISEQQLDALRDAAPELDLQRVAEIEAETRHDVVAHLRHFAEQAPEAGGILHLGATSAFVTDNSDALLVQEALQLIEGRLAAAIEALSEFARQHRATACLAYTHFQPAQLTTVGKRACLWLQDLMLDLEEVQLRRRTLRCRGAKGTTGTQASYLTLFDGDAEKVRRLDRMLAERLGFEGTFPVTGQTYSRKQDSRVLATLAGIGESCHKFGTDLRLLQGLGEVSEPFGTQQVGSSAMAYKRNPIRAERMCSLSRRLMTDSLNGPLTAATQWLERSLDDSANRRLVLPDAFLTADAILGLANYIASGLRVHEGVIATRVARELPFMATETLLMHASLRGGDRQALHERIRQYSLAAQEELERGGENTLIEHIVDDPEFRLQREEVESWLDPQAFTGRSAEQVEDYLNEVVSPQLDSTRAVAADAPRV